MPTLLHFTAMWAESICGPHRIEVREAASTLGWCVVECDVDVSGDEARMYGVLNVPAVAIEGEPTSTMIGARARADLIAGFSGRP